MRRPSLMLALAAVVLSASSAAAQSSRVEVGMLTCRGATTSFILGSVSDLRCVFQRSDGRGDRYGYRANVRRFGPDIGIYQTTIVRWAVFARTRKIGRGDLRGTYAGVSAGVSVGVGLGANALIGGSNNTIALQPLSVEGHTGLGIAIGVAGLTLR